MSLLEKKEKKPLQVFDHHDCVLLLKSAQIHSHRGNISCVQNFFNHVDRSLSDPTITKKQAYNKLNKMKREYEDRVVQGIDQFKNPYKQELHDECKKVWGEKAGFSALRMDVISQELLKRPYWELGWNYQNPGDQLTTNECNPSNKKKPDDLYSHGDCIMLVKAAQTFNHKHKLISKEDYFRHLEGRLSDPRVTSKQAYDKRSKIKARYDNWVSKGEHQFKNPYDQELHDECEIAWGREADMSRVALEVISQEFLKRNYQKLGWTYRKPQ